MVFSTLRATRALARYTRTLMLLLACFSWQLTLAQSLLQASGPKIVNASGQEVLLKGMNLGGWMLQEGYMMKPGYGGTQGSIKKLLYQAGQSDAQVESFYQQWRDNFITRADINYIAAKGFNCVRLPMHYELFLTPSQRAVRNNVIRGTVSYSSYVASLTDWYNTNQLFTDPASLEAIRLIDKTLDWCGANKMYVVLDLHAAPGAQGTDTNISDALQPNDFWNNTINQDITNRLWAMLATRYKNDPRVAMYDLINEPNNVPGGNPGANQAIHNVLQRLINTVRATGDNHLLLLEGNGYGNNFDYMEKRTFTNQANLVYNTHRYDGTGYPLTNDVNAKGGSANQLGLIGNMTSFRTDNNVPIWVGETGENTPTWMAEAARNLNSVGIGWCHWTFKRFEDGPNAAFMHIVPPYMVDNPPSNLAAVLEHIKFANCVPNDATITAVAPNPTGTPPPPPPIASIITLKGNNGLYVSSEKGVLPMNCNRATVGPWELFAVLDAGNGKVALRSLGLYVSSENGTQPITCNRTTISDTEAFDWIATPSNNVSLLGSNGRYVSSESGTGPMTCTSIGITAAESFNYTVVGNIYAPGSPLATTPGASTPAFAYPNPVTALLTYALPSGTNAHTLTVADATGRTVLTRTYGNTGLQNTFDTSGLAGGLYVVRLTGANFTQSFKVTKE
jgi:endoglucanase